MSPLFWISLVFGLPAGAYGLLLVYLTCIQRRLVFPAPTEITPWGSLSVERPDGVLRGWSTNPGAPAAVVVFGGNSMPVAGVAAEWSFGDHVAVFTMPYRGYEGQMGRPSEAALVADGIALVEHVRRAHQFVVLVGISLGSGVATQVAAATQPDRVVLVTPYDRLDRVAQDQWPVVPTRWIMRDRFDSLTAIKKLAGIPVSIVQADQDTVVRAARTETLARAIPGGPVAWVRVPTSHSGVWMRPEVVGLLRDQFADASVGAPASRTAPGFAPAPRARPPSEAGISRPAEVETDWSDSVGAFAAGLLPDLPDMLPDLDLE